MIRLPPPEQLHYETIQAFLQTSIDSGAAFLFDNILFDVELQRLWETYNVPYPVSTIREERTCTRHCICIMINADATTIPNCIPLRCRHCSRSFEICMLFM